MNSLCIGMVKHVYKRTKSDLSDFLEIVTLLKNIILYSQIPTIWGDHWLENPEK